MSLSRIYSGIEIVNIQRLVELNQPIDEISSIVHQIADEVSEITSVLARFSATNRDQQYYNVVQSIQIMCNKLNQGAEELYNCQQAISALMEKLADYEEVSISVSTFTLAEFPFPNIDVDPTTTIFVKQEMIYVYEKIGGFCNTVVSKLSEIENVPETATGWQDEQKQALQDYIDGMVDTLIRGCQCLVEYQNHLGELIGRLS